jgi:hypothetical protein
MACGAAGKCLLSGRRVCPRADVMASKPIIAPMVWPIAKTKNLQINRTAGGLRVNHLGTICRTPATRPCASIGEHARIHPIGPRHEHPERNDTPGPKFPAVTRSEDKYARPTVSHQVLSELLPVPTKRKPRTKWVIASDAVALQVSAIIPILRKVEASSGPTASLPQPVQWKLCARCELSHLGSASV